MKKNISKIAITCFALVFPIGAISCAPEASDQEVQQMCRQLLVLRRKENDKNMFDKCIREAKEEAVSQRQATCRITAVNTLEYWNRCRTGAARK